MIRKGHTQLNQTLRGTHGRVCAQTLQVEAARGRSLSCGMMRSMIWSGGVIGVIVWMLRKPAKETANLVGSVVKTVIGVSPALYGRSSRILMIPILSLAPSR